MFGPRTTEDHMSKKFFAFVLMPFSSHFDDAYKLGIKEAAKEAGVHAERLDEQIFDSNMLEKIYSEIDRADLVIADMSERNPNVFYEVGYADARKKLVILLTNKAEDIPFDLLHRPHIIYDGSISKLKNELAERLTWAKEEVIKREKEPIRTESSISYSFVDRTEHNDTAVVGLKFELFNVSENPVTDIHSIYLYTSDKWNVYFDEKLCKKTQAEIKPYQRRHIIKPDFNAIPSNDWLPIDLKAKQIMAAEWRGEERKDAYPIEGYIRIDIHTGKHCYSTENKISTIATWDDLPF
jgi:hypothetical protein